MDELALADIILVPSWCDPAENPDQSMLNALVTAHSRGSQIVGICLGTYVLAYVGFLKIYRVTTHCEFEQNFISRFLDVKLDSNALYVDDDRLIASAGTAAGLDCCLYLVRQYYGSVIANNQAWRMVIPPYREGDQAHDLDELAQHKQDEPAYLFTRQFYKVKGMSVGE